MTSASKSHGKGYGVFSPQAPIENPNLARRNNVKAAGVPSLSPGLPRGARIGIAAHHLRPKIRNPHPSRFSRSSPFKPIQTVSTLLQKKKIVYFFAGSLRWAIRRSQTTATAGGRPQEGPRVLPALCGLCVPVPPPRGLWQKTRKSGESHRYRAATGQK